MRSQLSDNAMSLITFTLETTNNDLKKTFLILQKTKFKSNLIDVMTFSHGWG